MSALHTSYLPYVCKLPCTKHELLLINEMLPPDFVYVHDMIEFAMA